MRKLMSSILTLAEKDVRVELRTKESLYSTFLFVVLILFIFNFSFSMNTQIVQQVAPGIIWVVIAFSGSIAISHLAHKEHGDNTGDGLLMTGIGGTTLFLSKFLTALLFMILIELVTIPLFMIFFNFDVGNWLGLFVMVLMLGTIGYAAVGTLFGALIAHARLKDLLFPVIFYPVIIPLLIACVKATGNIMEGEDPSALGLLIGFDAIFVTACGLLYDFVMEDPS